MCDWFFQFAGLRAGQGFCAFVAGGPDAAGQDQRRRIVGVARRSTPRRRVKQAYEGTEAKGQQGPDPAGHAMGCDT